jgi:hypothetical protein
VNEVSNPRASTTGECRYRVDAFTRQSAGTSFPENSFDAADRDEVDRIVGNLLRPVTGIVIVEIWDCIRTWIVPTVIHYKPSRI